MIFSKSKLSNSKSTLIILILIFLFIIWRLSYPSSVLAFEDQFDGDHLNTDKWQVYENNGHVNISDGFINLSSSVGTFPYIYSKQNPFPEIGDFSFKIKIQHPVLTLRGNGVVIGNLIPPNGTNDQYFLEHDQDIILFQIQNDSYRNLRVSYRSCRDYNDCDDERFYVLKFEENNTDLNEFQIIYSGNQYKLFLNEELIFTSNETLRRPNTLYIGNPVDHHNNFAWSNLKIDYIEIKSLSSPPMPLLDTIIILPGLGASWNHEDIILNIHKEPQDWHMTPFIKAYDGLIQSLRNAGYNDSGENQNLFIFNYDWRQPIETITNQLKDYIRNTVNPSPDTNIDIIGHSLGGMVGRTYVQNNPDHQVDQLITIGSPHKGAPQVYYLWEGADLKRTLQPWQRIAGGIVLQLRKKDFENNVETLRNILPGLKDLLPTFSYLRDKGIEKPLVNMNQRNDWLENLNNQPLPIFLTSVFNNFVGLKSDTLRWINIKDRNIFDKFFGRWEDGKPVSEEFEIGDGSVLVESAQLNGVNIIELNGLNHRELVESTTGQEAIIDLLGLSPIELVPAQNIIYEPSLVFQVASKANLTVFEPGGIPFAERQKLVFIPNPQEGVYQVQINPEYPGGPYRLLIGKIIPEGDIWTELSGILSTEPQNYSISFSINSQNNKLELLRLAKDKIIETKTNAEKIINPFKLIILKKLNKQIIQINKILNLFENGENKKAQIKTYQLILNISLIEKHLEIWGKFIPPLTRIKEDLRIVQDYLLQAYEIE